MLVFRCECEQVLGVDDESNKGGMGECPTCGRIIRVPQALVNASGKLRLAGTPARAMAASGAFRQIKDALPKDSHVPNGTGKPVGSQSGFEKAAPAISASFAAALVSPPPPINVPSTPPVATASSVAPPDLNPTEVLTEMVDEPATVLVAPAAPAATAATSPSKPAAIGKAIKGGIAKRPPIKNQKFIPSKKDANDPNAAIETKNDRNLAAVANAAASKRAKAASADSGAAVPAKKNVMLIYMLAVVAIVIIVGVLFALGIIGGEPAKSNTTPTGSTAAKKETKPTTTPETKVATTPDVKPEPTDPAKAPEVKPPADGEKKDPAAEPKTDDKKDEKKDPAADTTADDKK